MSEVDLFRKIHDDIKKLKDYENRVVYIDKIFGIEATKQWWLIKNHKEYFVCWQTNDQCDARDIAKSASSEIENKTNIKNRKCYISESMIW